MIQSPRRFTLTRKISRPVIVAFGECACWARPASGRAGSAPKKNRLLESMHASIPGVMPRCAGNSVGPGPALETARVAQHEDAVGECRVAVGPGGDVLDASCPIPPECDRVAERPQISP